MGKTEAETESCSGGQGHVQFSPVAQLCPTPCTPMNCSTPGLPVQHQLPEAMLSKPLIQFSIEGKVCAPSLLFDLRPNSGGGNENNGDLLQKVPGTLCSTQCPQSCTRPPPTHASARDSWTLIGKSGSVSCGVIALFSWVLVCTRFCLCPPRVCFPSPV